MRTVVKIVGRGRLFASPPGEPRVRRATDVLLLVPALGGVALLVAAYPPSEFERSFSSFLDSAPGWLGPVWAFLYDLLPLWALVLLGFGVFCRRRLVVFEAVGAAVVAVAVAVVSARLALGHWPDVGLAILGRDDSPTFPAVRVAESAAVLIAVSPHLVRPLRRVGRFVIGLGIAGSLFAGVATPGGNLTALLVAITAAATIRLAVGTSAGRPGLSQVGLALTNLGVTAEQIAVADRQVAGVYAVLGKDAEGRELIVKVYGRDAYDNQALARFWRMLLYRDAGAAPGLSRAQAAEHEAFATLLARNAGVPTREVVTAGQTVDDDALVVLRGSVRPLADLSEADVDDGLLDSSWRTLALLGRANIAHLQIDPFTVAVVGHELGLVDFAAATVAPNPDQLQVDRAQLLATTATVVGPARAVRAAVASLGTEGLASLLPYLQPAAFSRSLRRALKTAAVDIDELRKQAAEAAEVEPPELFKLRRVTWWTLTQTALLILAASALFNYFSGIDWDQLANDLADAAWGWIAFGFVFAQLPRVTQAVGTLGSIPAKLPLGRVYALQLATSYLNLALPSSLARMAVDIRFFQRQGLPGTAAVTSSVIDSFTNNVVQAFFIILILLFSESSVTLDLSSPSDDSTNLIWILLVLLVAAVLVVAFVRPLREAVLSRVRRWWPEAKASIGALRAGHKLLLLIGGNIATELLFAISLGLFTRGLGYSIPLTDLLLINESVSLLSSFIPVPGGIGVVEFGLSVGLTSAGMSQTSALSAVLLYRIATFYLPPVWGWFAFQWLQRNRYL